MLGGGCSGWGWGGGGGDRRKGVVVCVLCRQKEQQKREGGGIETVGLGKKTGGGQSCSGGARAKIDLGQRGSLPAGGGGGTRWQGCGVGNHVTESGVPRLRGWGGGVAGGGLGGGGGGVAEGAGKWGGGGGGGGGAGGGGWGSWGGLWGGGGGWGGGGWGGGDWGGGLQGSCQRVFVGGWSITVGGGFSGLVRPGLRNC